MVEETVPGHPGTAASPAGTTCGRQYAVQGARARHGRPRNTAGPAAEAVQVPWGPRQAVQLAETRRR
ncbi:hypothetical protein E2C01_090648 [Portunus trituberculatus]|uniref:Uncharacterized protein n=1 Tax=Portunus trituberculatus TaxID=210409 RepID=A0A5B7JMB5_PORTR|nr:hypothetical protein [Portunus trituberculatus]